VTGSQRTESRALHELGSLYGALFGPDPLAFSGQVRQVPKVVGGQFVEVHQAAHAAFPMKATARSHWQ
jgi:hypothetical protein